jgi:hypothetical protein
MVSHKTTISQIWRDKSATPFPLPSPLCTMDSSILAWRRDSCKVCSLTRCLKPVQEIVPIHPVWRPHCQLFKALGVKLGRFAYVFDFTEQYDESLVLRLRRVGVRSCFVEIKQTMNVGPLSVGSSELGSTERRSIAPFCVTVIFQKKT